MLVTYRLDLGAVKIAQKVSQHSQLASRTQPKTLVVLAVSVSVVIVIVVAHLFSFNQH